MTPCVIQYGSLKFYMYTVNEHNPAHVHVDFGGKYWVFLLEDWMPRDSELPEKVNKSCKKIILKYRDFLFDNRNIAKKWWELLFLNIPDNVKF